MTKQMSNDEIKIATHVWNIFLFQNFFVLMSTNKNNWQKPLNKVSNPFAIQFFYFFLTLKKYDLKSLFKSTKDYSKSATAFYLSTYLHINKQNKPAKIEKLNCISLDFSHLWLMFQSVLNK